MVIRRASSDSTMNAWGTPRGANTRLPAPTVCSCPGQVHEDLAVEQVHGLVGRMGVQWRDLAPHHRRLPQRERAPGVGRHRLEHECGAAVEPALLALVWPYHETRN